MKFIKNLKLLNGNYIKSTKIELWDFDDNIKCNYKVSENETFVKDAKNLDLIYSIPQENQEQILKLCYEYNNFEDVQGVNIDDIPDGASVLSLEILYSNGEKIKNNFIHNKFPECIIQLNKAIADIVENSNNASGNLIFEFNHMNWSEYTTGDWINTKWKIYNNCTAKIYKSYAYDKELIYNIKIDEQVVSIINNKINSIKENNTQVSAYDGSAWEIFKYDDYGISWHREAGYIYGIKELEDIANILYGLLDNCKDQNLDRQELSKILEMFHQEIKDLQPNEIDNSIFLKYLQMLKEKLNYKEYSSDNRFVTYCRRDFLRQEMTDRLEQKVYTGINYLLEAFYDLEDYINNDTWISISSVCNLPNSKEIIANDTSYKNDGKICKEEKEILIDMIDEFIRKIDGTLNNNMQNINENVDDNSSILLTLKEWWGEGSYGHKAIHVFYDGKVLLKEENTIIRENGKKKRMEKNEHIATLDESDLDCLTNIIQVINNNFSNQEIPIICDYGVEVIINCGPLNICIENDAELYDSLKNIVETLIERTKKQAELDYNAIKDIFIMKYFDEGKVNKLKEDVKSKNIEIEKDLCTTLIYFCLATLPDDKQTLETIYTLIDSYKNNINNTIQKFDCEHPIHKYNNKLKSLTELELDEIINILKNKLYYCKNIAQFREMLYLVCCDEDIQFISKCVIELQKDEKIEEYIKTQVNDDNQEAINYIKNIEITEDFPLISKLKENLENLL